MEESESIMYALLLTAALVIMPEPSVNNDALFQISAFVIVTAKLLSLLLIILLAVKNIPILSPYVPVTLGDKTIKELSWIGVLVASILLLIVPLVNLIE